MSVAQGNGKNFSGFGGDQFASFVVESLRAHEDKASSNAVNIAKIEKDIEIVKEDVCEMKQAVSSIQKDVAKVVACLGGGQTSIAARLSALESSKANTVELALEDKRGKWSQRVALITSIASLAGIILMSISKIWFGV